MKTLVIPDVHQDINWVRRILDKETDFDELVFLGDYFDDYAPQPFSSAKNVAKYLHEVAETYDPTFLIGNHDAQYLVFRRSCPQRKYEPTAFERHWMTGGYSRNRCQDINRHLTTSVTDRLKLAKYTQGFLLTHAGVLDQLWDHVQDVSDLSGDRTVNRFVDTVNAYTSNLSFYTGSPCFYVGSCRDNVNPGPYPGLLWCDFDVEFTNTLGVPQIVGHTSGESPRSKDTAQPSYCLDAGQTAYGTIVDGQLTIRFA